MNRPLAPCLAFLLAACAGAPRPELATAAGPGLEGEPRALAGRLEELRRATLARDRDALREALAAPEGPVRAAAARGLGRCQEVADGSGLAPLAADPERLVREEAAVALGLLGLAWVPPSAGERAALEAPLVARVPVEEDRAVLRAMAWALGRTAGADGAAALATLAGHRDPAVRAEALFSLGLLSRKAPATAGPHAARAAVAARRDPDPEVRSAAAFALVWSAGPAETEVVAALARDADPATRAFAARALGEVAAAPSLLEALLADPDPRVRVEAVRGLNGALARAKGEPGPGGRSRSPDPAGAAVFEGALLRASFRLARGLVGGADPGAAHPLELLLRPPGGAAPAAAASAALGLLETPGESPAAVRLDVARLHCAAAASLARGVGSAGELGRCGGGLVPPAEVRRLEAAVLGELVDRDATVGPRLLALAGDADPAVRAAALRGLGASPDPAARRLLLDALAGADPRAAAAAADALGREGNREAAPALRAAIERGGDADVAAAAVAALAALGAPDDDDREAIRVALADRRPAVLAAARDAAAKLGVAEAPASPAFAPWLLAAAPPAGLALRLETDRGVVRLALDVERAPVAAANLAALAERGLLDGTPFHRIEPGFVAQGGDPWGDGTGGPGYTIPCENAATPYRRGTVGMALGGKDTGGSQFFVTYARTPHLEGRYTAFGEVTEGLQVVDRLLPGDRIRRAFVERPDAVEIRGTARRGP